MLLSNVLEHAIRTSPNNKAFISEDAQTVYTYKEAGTRIGQLKESLIKLGLEKGERVACLMLNDHRYIEIFYGTTAMGGIVVPLNIRLSPIELIEIINDAEPKVLYIHKEFLSLLPELKKHAPSIEHIILAEENSEKVDEIIMYEEILKEQGDVVFTGTNIDEEDIAGLYYTGGTTGRSKGVMLSHRNLTTNAFQSMLYHRIFDQNTTYLHAAPMFHLADGATTSAITLLCGTHTFVRSFTPDATLKVIQDTKVEAALLVPVMINAVINSPNIQEFDISSLERIVYGASPISPDILRKAMSIFPGVKFFQAYGMTEASPVLTILNAEDHITDGSEEKLKRLSSGGRAVPFVDMKVVDENRNEIENGVIGEFAAKGPNIMKGYWKMPEVTDEVLEDGWYYTGDLGYRDDAGYYYVVDRAKDMIITGGENVYSVEVESVLYEIPDILECAVIGVPDEQWGEAVKATIVLKQENSISEEEILAFVRERLANYKVPKSVDFMEELPKSGAGKILKRELRDIYWKEKNRNIN